MTKERWEEVQDIVALIKHLVEDCGYSVEKAKEIVYCTNK